MKRLAIVLLGFLLLNSILFGCNVENNISDITDNPNNIQGNDSSDAADNVQGNTIGISQLNISWTLPEEIKNIQVPYSPTDYSPNVKPYTIEEDLSNIENINQFSGFTDEQKQMLLQNGFAVLPNRYTKLNFLYEQNEYLDIPSFITTDTVLHLYHQFYEKSLLNVEIEYLTKDLEALTDSMLNKSIALIEHIEDNELREIQKKNIAYFLVAKMLVSGNSNVEISIDNDILKLATQEIELIENATGFGKSPLFDIGLDYSQFTVRGHYTRNAALENFFKTMMWYGFTPIELMNLETEELYYENTLKALLVSYTAFLENQGTNDIKVWNNIYEPTGFYVGQSDDINIVDVKNVIISVFGEDANVNSFNDPAHFDKLHQGVRDLREPKIVGKFLEKPTAKSFKFMGQRYILDGYVMQELMEPIKRPVPTGLDVMGVFGSKRGEDLLFKVHEPQKAWPEYEGKYNELKQEVESYSNDIWQSNLYNGWLWSIIKQLTEFSKDSGMPMFMTNDAWRSKSLNAALSSYAELKHDTVLYGKQPVAEMGGPMPTFDQHYVEPNIELFDSLIWLLDYTTQNLEYRGLLNDEFREGSQRNIELLKLLRTVSLKELNNEPLTEDEKNSLLWVGGTIEAILNNYTLGSTSEDELINGIYPVEKSAMLVSDVATLPNNHYLSMGTGYFDEIFVVVPVEGKLYLTRGAVYSYYEFVTDKRLTDTEWQELHGLKTIKDDYYEYFEYGEPSNQLPAQPFWINSFKSKTNDVKIEPPEIDWDKLNE